MSVLRVSIPCKGFEDRFDAESIVEDFTTNSAMQAFSAGYRNLTQMASENGTSLDKSTVLIRQIKGENNGVHTLFGWTVEGWASEVKN